MYHERIKEARKQKGLTQKQLAEAAGIAVGSMSAYEKGTQEPPVGAAYRIAAALGVSLDWLFNEDMSQEEARGTARSLGDVARAFLVMVDAGILHQSKCEYVEWRESIIQFSEYMQCVYESEEDDNGSVATVLRVMADFEEGSKLIPFVEGVYKLNELVSRGTIDKDIYQTWLAKILEDLDKVALSKR